MRLRFIFLFVIGMLINNIAFSQSNPAPNKEFPEQIPSNPMTPDAAGLFKFSDFAVDHSSGTVNTVIPLFSASSGRINLPVSLKYASNGIKVQDIASSVGLGWNLDFGYSISVTEEEPKLYSYSGRLYKDEDAANAATNLGVDWVLEMKRAADGYYSTFFPVYRFGCGGYSGTFYYDEHGAVPNLVSFGDNNSKSIRIEKLTSGSDIYGFKITTPDGLEYTFDKKETSLRVAQVNALGPVTTSFLCTKVRDPLTDDAITFEYAQVPTYSVYSENSILRYAIDFQGAPGGSNTGSWLPSSDLYHITRSDVSAWAISKISFKEGYAVFNVANDRLDINPTRIKGVTIYSYAKGNFPIRMIDFNQSYFQTGGGSLDKYNYRLRLDGVVSKAIQYPDFIPVENYSFAYNNISLPPYRVVSTSREQNANGIDYWGFYNGGANGGMSFLPQDIVNLMNTTYSSYGVNRKANPSYAQACILTTVKYPTGGEARFQYESHTLPGYYLGDYLGGVRVKNIQYFENSTDATPKFQKSYNYTSPIALTPATKDMYGYVAVKGVVDQAPPVGQIDISSYHVGVISSDPFYDFAYHNGSPLFYQTVEEYNGTTADNNGKTVYSFYYNPPYYAPIEFIDMGYKKLFPENFGRGQLAGTEIYKKTGNASNPYEKIYQETTTYYGSGAFQQWPNLVGFGVRKKSSLDVNNYVWDWVGPQADSFYTSLANTNQIPRDAFLYNNFFLGGVAPVPTKKETSSFINGQEVKTTTIYEYQSQYHPQLSAVSTTDSKGETNRVEYKYVQDRTNITDVDATENTYAFNSLLNFNKLNDVIEQNTYKNGALIEKKRNRYVTRWNNSLSLNMPVISTNEVTTYNGANSLKSKQFLKGYNDALKILGFNKENGITTSYLYDDYNANVIAEVSNADYADIRYTSFEPGASGKWVISGGRAYDSQAISGDYVYSLNSSNTLSATGLNSSQIYTVSYWSKSGAYIVSGSSAVTTGAAVGLWVFYQHKVTGQTTVSISGTGTIDEVRLYPQNAQMTSYAYDSMIGVRSKIDKSNKILNYKYDGFGRLIQIADQNKNIIQSYNYHYRN